MNTEIVRPSALPSIVNPNALKVTLQTVGVYNHGKLKGRLNPKAVAKVTLFAEFKKDGVAEAVSRFLWDCEGVAHNIIAVDRVFDRV